MSENNNMFNTNSSLLQLALPRPEFAIFEKVQKRICINFVKCSIPDVWGCCEFAWGPEYTSDGSEYGSSSEYAKALYKPGFWIYQAISLKHSKFIMLREQYLSQAGSINRLNMTKYAIFCVSFSLVEGNYYLVNSEEDL